MTKLKSKRKSCSPNIGSLWSEYWHDTKSITKHGLDQTNEWMLLLEISWATWDKKI